MSDRASPAWLIDMRRRAEQAPVAAREPLCIGETACGSIEPALAQEMLRDGLPLRREARGWSLVGPVDEALAAVAHWLHRHGHGGRWRGELLAVTSDNGDVQAVVERAAVRVLGIATYAVHLVGCTPHGSVWVQRRALDKAVDPGLLDTLVGGLAAANETTEQTLERETWEEAGLRLDQLHRLARFGRLTVRRPVSDGYMVEHNTMFEAELPDGTAPVNQDGEVMGFACVTPVTLIGALQAEQFTFEATLIHAAWLERHGLV